MGYAAEKKKAERKWRRMKVILAVGCFALALVCALIAVFIPPSSWKYRMRLPNVDERLEGELRIHFIDVGQGDATLIELPDAKVALIDGGNGGQAAEYAIMRYLYALDIETVDYLIVTHADEDHCGALDTVLKYIKVKNAYLPVASATVNTQYAEFYTALMKEKNCRIAYAKNGLEMNGENYTFTFLYPYGYDVDTALKEGKTFDENSNEYSAVVWLDYNGVSALFTGDLPSTKENLFIDTYASGLSEVDVSDTEILKVGHHGSKYSTSAEFLALLSLETAVISCGESEYGHPDDTVLERLRVANTSVYRTDKQGGVVISVGKNAQTYDVQTLGK
ncbi:MAG: MBL fold metallo-hydrolase [Clostridia bacterium]|nr:MBL fold metallo-hydrolase [Clostridia bacterium]